ncbi:MAG TPA: transcriptional repressor [bacterium]|nr:transcriptional repressor [bacterium]HEX67741.1 transcriptional repressor [bacterium]
MTGVERFRLFLREKGLKFTPERRKIAEEIFSFHDHFDAETLYRRLKREVSLATIYRTLPLLRESGLIREVLRCQGRGVFESVWGHPHHDHLICIRCGKIIEFEDERIEKLQEEVCRKFGFQPVEHRLGIKGYCKECQKKLK